jgi:hypothetical protein
MVVVTTAAMSAQVLVFLLQLFRFTPLIVLIMDADGGVAVIGGVIKIEALFILLNTFDLITRGILSVDDATQTQSLRKRCRLFEAAIGVEVYRRI